MVGESSGKQPIRALSLFSGGGGLDLGFAAAGYSIICSTDIDPFSCKTLELNVGKKRYYNHAPVIETNISEVRTEELLEKAKINPSSIDVVLGGPPCQAFSVFGRRRGLKDPRGNLVWDYIRVVKDIKPTVFVFENVAGLKSVHNGELYQDLLEELSIDGEYVVSDHKYQIADYGIPQYRDRVFFIGWKSGKRIPPMIPTHGEPNLLGCKPHVTSDEALRNLPELGPNGNVPNHVGRNHSERIIRRYANLKFGERDHKTRINKLHPDRPSFTIIVGSDAGGGKGHVHPYSPREVTPRESARMQTFPDWWEFSGTGRHVIRQVGNAVPPLFAALLGSHVKKFVYGEKRVTNYRQFLDILGLEYLKSNTSDN